MTLIFNLLTLKLVRIIDRGVRNLLPILLFLRLFVLDLWSNTCQTHHVTSSPWPLTFEIIALLLMRLFMLQLCTKFEVRRPSNSAHDALPLSSLVDLSGLVTLTFYLLTLRLVFLGLFVLDLWSNTCHAHLASRSWPLTLLVMALIADIGFRPPSVYPVHVSRPFLSEDMTHFRSQH